MTKRSAITIYLSLIFALLALVAGWYIASFLNREPDSVSFDSSRAYADVQTQVAFGPRTPGSAGHAQVREWMRTELESAGWIVEIHESERLGHPIYNLIAKRSDEAPQIILGAHYDTRFFADHDPDESKRTEPVPGANDGASGVAVLLELARSLPDDTVPVWLVFFDTEDNGRIAGWDWILGSRAFAEEITVQPQAVVIVDMIGDADQQIYYDASSDPLLSKELFTIAAQLGYEKNFIPQMKYSMMDDHTPFLQRGIPSVDLIDFDYPAWHTTQDTADKLSAASLERVGRVIQVYVEGK